MPDPLLEVQGLKKYFPISSGIILNSVRGWVKAVDGIDFQVGRGETLGVVGESGCGKTTTAKLVLAQERPTEGSIHFKGKNVADMGKADLMQYRKSVQAVFQDPYSSLSPRMRVESIVAEPLEVHTKLSKEAVKKRVGEVMELVGLQPDDGRLFPHEFSGGQRQRIAIARALATEAELIVLDEPVSALDVSIRANILTLLESLQRDLGVSYIFIGHDLAAVAHISDRISVMYLGKIVETADSLELCNNPKHPYTRALFAASLPSHPDDVTEDDDMVLAGEVPSALNPPSGCRFHPRCPVAMPHCAEQEPVIKELDSGHQVACHLY
jgi:oligopeptide transport system ATP-binding protein